MTKEYDFSLEDIDLLRDKDAYLLDLLNGHYSLKETRLELAALMRAKEEDTEACFGLDEHED